VIHWAYETLTVTTNNTCTIEHGRGATALNNTLGWFIFAHKCFNLTSYSTVIQLNACAWFDFPSQEFLSSASILIQLIKEERNSLKLTFPFLSQSISSAYIHRNLQEDGLRILKQLELQVKSRNISCERDRTNSGSGDVCWGFFPRRILFECFDHVFLLTASHYHSYPRIRKLLQLYRKWPEALVNPSLMSETKPSGHHIWVITISWRL